MFSGQKQLNQVTDHMRVTILYEYLVLGYSMDEIALSYYDDKNWAVSAVCQGYSEKGGRNRGKVRASQEEIWRFVHTYPNGTYDLGITLSDFLSQSGGSQYSSHYSQINQPRPTYQNQYDNTQNNHDNAFFSQEVGNSASSEILSLLVGALMLIVLVWFIIGKWFGHPIIALIIIGFFIYGLVEEIKGR